MLSSMEADRARISKIEAEIMNLQDSISALRAEKQLVEERLDSYKYPVLTLPNEMVSEIFLHTLPPYPLCPQLFGRTSPTSLTHICRKWREIALATPELWRAIRVSDVSSIHRERPESEVWTKRSGSFPLLISIQIHHSREIYPELLDRCSRWEHLTLSVYTPAIINIDGPMPLLRHLELTQHDGHGSVELRDAPQLRSVVIPLSWAVTLPWQQLTHLTMDRSVTSQCIQILQQTTNLVYCDVTVWSVGPDELDDDEPGSHTITLTVLESLVFNMNPAGLGTRFLDLLTVPALRSLEIPERCIGLDPVHYLISFLAKSHCRLQILDITGRRRLMPSRYRVAFPSVPELVFNRSYFEESSDEEDSDDEEDGFDSDEDDSDSTEADSENSTSDGQTDFD
ncbi:hypothetical protein C8R45DRAFT_323869 [Mycena sanguinolenta]|nr:hypothetical protein C8R45DRAFT_323869 [Mycena sanguinolenta]